MVTTGDGIGLLEKDEIALLDTPYPHLGAVLTETGSFASLANARVRSRVPLDEARFVAPLGTPAALWGVGLNYRSKAARAGRSLPVDPILFLAAPGAVGGPEESVAVPDGVTEEMDYEAEIALVIGKDLHRASEDEVWPAVAGITAANDMTARDVMRSTALPVLAKSFPGFKPLGPSVCTMDELADRDNIPVRSWVNDVLHQDDTSAGFIFDVPDLLARISRYTPLRPGDVVLTGTPAGTGQDRSSFLVPGDCIRIQIGPLLPLVTNVAAA